MYIGKLKSNIIIVWEETSLESQIKDESLDFISKHKISLNNIKQLFDRIPKGWIEAKPGYLLNGDLELLAIYNQLYNKEDSKNYRLKLVRFPNADDPYIRLCSKGSCKKNYKNTVLLPNHLIADFCRDAKKYEWTELRKSVNPLKYEVWSKYIDENETK